MKIYKNTEGNAAIEFAIILPLLLLLIFAMIEFGAYFVKDQITLNAMGSISSALESEPSDPHLEEDAVEYGGMFLSFDREPNYFCAQAYATRAEANNGSCTSGWNTAKPAGLAASDPYYILLEARAEKLNIVFSDYLPDIDRRSIVTVGAPVVIPGVQTVRVNCLPGPTSACTATCPPNTQLTGGGVQWLATTGTCHIHTSYPSGNSWIGGTSRTNSSTGSCTAAVFAVCL